MIKIDGYQTLRELGRGGMGEVYLAEHLATGKRVALKTLSSHGAMSRYQRDSFQREIENTRALRHGYGRQQPQ